MNNKTENNINVIIALLFWSLIFYAICAFLSFELNMGDWHWALRFLFGVLEGIALVHYLKQLK